MSLADRWITLFNKPIPNVILRLVMLFGGFLSMAMSIALMRTTGLGNGPISCIPATLSYLVPLTLGTITFIMNTCFLAVQAILLRRDFNPVQLLQIPFTFVFALMIDQLLPFCETLPMQYYPEQLGWNILGCFLLAMGVFLQVKASFITLPGEGIVLAIAKAAKKPFPKCKIAFDSSMVVVSVAISFIGLGYLQGVREGTIITALASGTIVALIGKLLPHFDRFCPVEGHISFIINVPMNGNEQPSAPENEGQPPLVIAIERQYGSGGREIGTLAGRELGIPSFDHTLIDLTAQESGFPPAYVKQHEQEVRRGLLYNLYMQNYRSVGAEPEQMDDMWLAQARAITKLADEGSCVIVGRCAGSILRGRKNVLTVFVHAPLEIRINHVMDRDGPIQKKQKSASKPSTASAPNIASALQTQRGAPPKPTILYWIHRSRAQGMRQNSLPTLRKKRSPKHPFHPAPKSLRGRASKTGLPHARVTRCALLLTWRDECAPPPRTDARAGKWRLFLFFQHISSMLED